MQIDRSRGAELTIELIQGMADNFTILIHVTRAEGRDIPQRLEIKVAATPKR